MPQRAARGREQRRNRPDQLDQRQTNREANKRATQQNTQAHTSKQITKSNDQELARTRYVMCSSKVELEAEPTTAHELRAFFFE